MPFNKEKRAYVYMFLYYLNSYCDSCENAKKCLANNTLIHVLDEHSRYIGVARITQLTQVRNKNSNIQGR